MASALPENPTSRSRRRRGRELAIWGWLLAFCLTALIATYVMFVEAPPPRSIVFASGSKEGAYYRFAQQYAKELGRQGIDAEVRETVGSVENLRMLGKSDSGVDIAIIQSGVAQPEDLEKFLALGSLYHEPLWVFHRADRNPARLSDLAALRIGIGPEGSGTQAIAKRLLASNGVIGSVPDSPGAKAPSQPVLVQETMAAAANALRQGDLDAAFFVAAFGAEYIQTLLGDQRVKLLSFTQHEAYHRRFRFLAFVTLPTGIVNLGKNIPDRDIVLMAPTAMLVVRKDFHPAIASLLLSIATRIHGRGDEFSRPGDFPSLDYCDFPMSDDAVRFHTSGQPVLQRVLPFWLASLVDRAKVMLIPLVMLLMPVLRAAPPLMRWRTRRKIYKWYSNLREIDQRLHSEMSSAELDQEYEHTRKIERQVAHVDVPLSYMEEFYHLRLHLDMLQQRILEQRRRKETETGPLSKAEESGRVTD